MGRKQHESWEVGLGGGGGGVSRGRPRRKSRAREGATRKKRGQCVGYALGRVGPLGLGGAQRGASVGAICIGCVVLVSNAGKSSDGHQLHTWMTVPFTRKFYTGWVSLADDVPRHNALGSLARFSFFGGGCGGGWICVLVGEGPRSPARSMCRQTPAPAARRGVAGHPAGGSGTARTTLRAAAAHSPPNHIFSLWEK